MRLTTEESLEELLARRYERKPKRLTRKEQYATMKEWDESEHPRDEQGKFTDKGSVCCRQNTYKPRVWRLYRHRKETYQKKNKR